MLRSWSARLVLLSFASACAREPDFEAFCKQAAPCEGKTIDSCVHERKALSQRQKHRGCGPRRARSSPARSSTASAGSWPLFMPTDLCLDPIQHFEKCLDRTRK